MSDLQVIGSLAQSRNVSCPVLFGSLIGIGYVNGLSEKISGALVQKGALIAALNTFDVSMFVWLALGAGLLLVFSSFPSKVRTHDWAIAALAGVAMLLPVPAMSWLAVTGLALFLFAVSTPGSTSRRGAAILFAATIPAFWAGVALSLLSDAVLAVDATLVSLAIGSERQGNLVPFADGSGALWIAPGCSSFTNLSLAILAFVGLVNFTSGKWSKAKLGLAALACVAVVMINVARISLIGYFPGYFDLIHGEVGASLAGWATTLAIIGIGWLAVRRDAITLG